MAQKRRSGAAGLTRPLALALLAGTAVTACSDDPTEPGNGGHGELGVVELETRGSLSTLIARWSVEDGWTDGDGNPIDAIEAPVERDAGLHPLVAGGEHASLTVRLIDQAGEEFDVGTVARDDATGERECTAHSARWTPAGGLDDPEWQEAERSFAFPNLSHPEGPRGEDQFAYRHTGELTGIFHCDHVYFHPEQAGEVEVEFQLYHIDHADDWTEPITMVVEEPEEPARIELATRGQLGVTLGVWTEGEGWTDGDGDPIEEIAEPREEDGALHSLVAGGDNASLTVRYFPYGGDEQADLGTVDQDPETGERACTYVQGRWQAADGGTGALAWPPESHPDDPDSESQFVERGDGTIAGIFHCDHIHFYPEEAGEEEVEITALAGRGEDVDLIGLFPLHVTDPIRVPVQEND